MNDPDFFEDHRGLMMEQNTVQCNFSALRGNWPVAIRNAAGRQGWQIVV